MENLQVLIRNLAVILLLASVLEMLLPNKSLKGYVKLVMGLFVISAILNPLTSFLGTMGSGIPAWMETSAQEMPVLASGEEGETIGTNAVHEQYRSIVINQVKALTSGIEGVKDLQVEVDLEEGSGGLTDIPRIGQISVTIESVRQGVAPIQEVVIDMEDSKSDTEQVLSALALEVRDKIAAFMQMPVQQIFVTEK